MTSNLPLSRPPNEPTTHKPEHENAKAKPNHPNRDHMCNKQLCIKYS
jgi:hypothetical protein